MRGVSDDRCTGFSMVRRLIGSGMVCWWFLYVPFCLSFVAVPGLCCFLRVKSVIRSSMVQL